MAKLQGTSRALGTSPIDKMKTLLAFDAVVGQKQVQMTLVKSLPARLLKT
jgi:hypothetical protein